MIPTKSLYAGKRRRFDRFGKLSETFGGDYNHIGGSGSNKVKIPVNREGQKWNMPKRCAETADIFSSVLLHGIRG